ncbi:hypothetical protein PR048_029237 [Dryococelus australis]|uniref:Uncharacterized protein n=1 Tax=Dryococelus australis TaxID=614101 RepID=A0ABQ9GCT8_9NEOP|nr:hypothetical protein PR048_029237 [Dryococelus australis]
MSVRQKNTAVRSEGRRIPSNTIAKCDEEAKQQRYAFTVNQATARAADCSGVSQTLIKKIRKEQKELDNSGEGGSLHSPEEGGRGGLVVRPLAPPPTIKANGVRFLAGLPSDDAAGRRVFSGISLFIRPCIQALPHSHIASPSSALNTTMLRAAQISLTQCTEDKNLSGPVYLEFFFFTFETEKRGSDKGDIATGIKCAITCTLSCSFLVVSWWKSVFVAYHCPQDRIYRKQVFPSIARSSTGCWDGLFDLRGHGLGGSPRDRSGAAVAERLNYLPPT